MQALTHRVQYYETDRMGVTHHSNITLHGGSARGVSGAARLPVCGTGTARGDFAVTAVNCKYLATTTFDDRITVDVRVEAFNGVVLTIGYDMTKQDGTRVFTGTSEHCFLNPEGHFIRLRRDQKEFYEMLMRELNVHHPAEGETSHE